MARYRLTTDPNFVFDNETMSTVPIQGNWQSDAYQEWLLAGNTPDPLPLPTFEQLVAQYEPEFEMWMESVAATNGYHSSLSCISYKASVVPEFNDDAVAMFNWRDALWVWLYGLKNSMNGEIPDPVPTIDQVKAMAPKPEDFGWVHRDYGITADNNGSPGSTT